MPKSGKLIITKVVLSTILTYMLMADQLPAWAIEDIDRIRRQFLWAGLVAWPIVCRPTAQGGLGVQNLKLADYALRTQWLWLKRIDADCAWASLSFKVEKQVQDIFDASIQIRVGNGAQTNFWMDC